MTRRKLRLFPALLLGAGLVVGLGTTARGDPPAAASVAVPRPSPEPGLSPAEVKARYGIDVPAAPPNGDAAVAAGITFISSSGHTVQQVCHGGICSKWDLEVAQAVDFGWEYDPGCGLWHIRVMRAVTRLTNIRGVIRGRMHNIVLRNDLGYAVDYTDYDSRSDQPVTSSSKPTVYGRAPVTAIAIDGYGWRSASQMFPATQARHQVFAVISVRWSDNQVSSLVTVQNNLTPEAVTPGGIYPNP